MTLRTISEGKGEIERCSASTHHSRITEHYSYPHSTIQRKEKETSWGNILDCFCAFLSECEQEQQNVLSCTQTVQFTDEININADIFSY